MPKSIISDIKLLQSIPGIGEITSITLISEIGDVKNFTKPKHLMNFFQDKLSITRIVLIVYLVCKKHK